MPLTSNLLICAAICLYITHAAKNCHLAYECAGKTFTSTDEVRCYNDACQKATITTTKGIQCSGTGSCMQSNCHADTIISCSGFSSCAKATLQVDNGYANCIKDKSCMKATIGAKIIQCVNSERMCEKAKLTADDNIILRGYQAAQKATMIAGDQITISGEQAAYKAKKIEAEDVIVNGDEAATYAKFYVGNSLLCNGERACANGKKVVGTGSSLEIIYDGLDAGAKSKIFCPSSGECTIHCVNNGCKKDTNVFYYSGTDLSIVPARCMGDISDDNCPTLKQKRGAEIAEILEQIDNEEMSEDDEEMDGEAYLNDEFLSVGGMNLRQVTESEFVSCIVIGIVGVMVFAIVVFSCCKREKYDTIQ